MSRVVGIEAKFPKIKAVRKEAVKKEDWLQKLVKEKSMIDKPLWSVNMCRSLFAIGYCEHVPGSPPFRGLEDARPLLVA